MRSRAINVRSGQKKSSGNRLPLLECSSTPYQLNSLFDLFIQQLWNNIGSILGKFTSFTARDGGWHKLQAKLPAGWCAWVIKFPPQQLHWDNSSNPLSTNRTSVHARVNANNGPSSGCGHCSRYNRYALITASTPLQRPVLSRNCHALQNIDA